MLELGADNLDASTAEFEFCSFGSLCSLSRYSNPVLDWLQANFMAWESGSYLKGPIRTRQDTAAQCPVPGSFNMEINVEALQCAFPGHYLSEPAESQPSSPLGSTITSPSGLHPTPTRFIPVSVSSPTPQAPGATTPSTTETTVPPWDNLQPSFGIQSLRGSQPSPAGGRCRPHS